MQGNLIENIPEWIELKILNMLDFNSLLNARATCQRWNDLIMPYLGESTILNIRMDKSPASKQFRRGKWNGQLIAPYQEIRIIPKAQSAFLLGKCKSKSPSSLTHFTDVRKFTLFENGSFLHFIHRYMRLLPNVKYLQIRQLPYSGKTSTENKYTFAEHVYSRALSHPKSWTIAMDNISKVETLRIRLYDRLAMMLYMQLFSHRMTTLTNVEFDFSKLNGIPMMRSQLLDIHLTLCDIFEHCYISLRQLRLKWAVRVYTDLDYHRCEEDIEPFFEFLISLRNPVWMKLRLQQLSLTFPIINLGLSLCEATLYPFLQEQVYTLRRCSLARVLPNAGIDTFAARFPPPTINKFEFTFFANETDMLPQPVTFIRGVEILLNNRASVELARLVGMNEGRRESGLKHYIHFKLINGHGNLNFVKPDLLRITEFFQNVRVLELLDSSSYGKTFATFTSADFNLIVKKLRRLVSLKLSNAAGLTDAGLTKIPREKINYMKRIGVFHLPNYEAPLAHAKDLRFLDLRDLSTHVSDFSVYFAFQQISRLEKISLHGSHSITSWGKLLLQSKNRKNPYFDVILREQNDEYVTYGNYTLPSADFP